MCVYCSCVAQSGFRRALARGDDAAAQQYAARMMQAAWRGRAARKEVAARKAALSLAKAGLQGHKAVDDPDAAQSNKAAAKIQVRRRCSRRKTACPVVSTVSGT